MKTVRIGVVGLGNNTKKRHVPGFHQCERVQIVGVCNRRKESTQQAAAEFGIPKTFSTWQQLVADDDIDAVMIGTWPYLHCPITLAALDHGKHVLTEARMARNLAEAHQMAQAAEQNSHLVAQIVPSPLGLRAGPMVKQLLQSGYLGELRGLTVYGTNADFADPSAPLHWRQSAELSGLNVLTLGILHETVIRWVPDPHRVMAAAQTFTEERIDADTNETRPVERPDSIQVLTELPGGAGGIYNLSGVCHHGSGFQIQLFGSDGTLRYDLAPEDRLFGAQTSEAALQEISVPTDTQGSWRVEADFIDAIRGGPRPELTDFATGVRYMEFTEAVARSAETGAMVSLPLDGGTV